MLTILSVIGTRPEAIKMAPVVRALRRQPEIRSLVCSTGQHRELLSPVFKLFEVQPDVELDVMSPGQSLAQLTSRLLTELDPVIERHQPDWVLAQGDTTTVLAAALAAFYRRARFAHVEAGLHTGNLRQPFPEELNRRLADQAAALLFAPTERSRQALLNEGHLSERIVLSGNTVIDALQHVAALPYDWRAGPLCGLPRDRRWVLITAHRRESFGEPFAQICLAIRDLAERFASHGIHFVYPVHPNPQVFRVAKRHLADLPGVTLLEPLDYLSLVQVMRRATLILTDSGGIQEEAPALSVPVLVLRETTERPEGIEAGVARLVGTERQQIVDEAARLLSDETARLAMARCINPYGDGHAAERIVSALLQDETT